MYCLNLSIAMLLVISFISLGCKERRSGTSNVLSSANKIFAGDKIEDQSSGSYGTLGIGVTALGGFPGFLTCASFLDSTRQNPVVLSESGIEIGATVSDNPSMYRNDYRVNAAFLILADALDGVSFSTRNLPSGVSIPSRFGTTNESDRDVNVYFIAASSEGEITEGYISDFPTIVTPAEGGTEYSDHFVVKAYAVMPEFFKKQDCGTIVFKADGTVIGMIRSFIDDDQNGKGDYAIVTKISEIVSALSIDSRLP